MKHLKFLSKAQADIVKRHAKVNRVMDVLNNILHGSNLDQHYTYKSMKEIFPRVLGSSTLSKKDKGRVNGDRLLQAQMKAVAAHHVVA